MVPCAFSLVITHDLLEDRCIDHILYIYYYTSVVNYKNIWLLKFTTARYIE